MPSSNPTNCFRCGTDLTEDDLYSAVRVCSNCHFHFHLDAWERVEQLCDPGSFHETSKRRMALDPLSFATEGQPGYKRRIFDAQRRTGLADAAITGRAMILGRPVVVAIIDFAFLGGSMGSVVGEKVAAAFEMAASRRLPMITVISSSGVRMQEGALALMQLAKTAAAANRLHKAGMPHISIWANPTTGGVYASFANLADFIVAEPDAIAGFAAMRVVQQATGAPLPERAHTAEWHLANGLIDQVCERAKLRTLVASLLELLSARFRLTLDRGKDGQVYEPPPSTAWHQVQLARHERRPSAIDLIGRMTTSFIELHGDRMSGDDEAVVAGLAQLGGEAVMLVGHERIHDPSDPHRGWIRPEGFRKAQRAYELAGKLVLPIVTLIDTRGAYPALDAEEHGLGYAIATTLARLSDIPVPTIACIVGEGGSEGALAFSLADRVLMFENAIFESISPEDAAAILYRDPGRATDVADALKLTAHDCKEMGVVDVIVPEPAGGAHTDHDEAARLLKSALLHTLTEIEAEKPQKLVARRYERYRETRGYANPLGATVARYIDSARDALQHGVTRAISKRPARPSRTPEPVVVDEGDESTAIP